jgi:acetolactate synthase small subunit
MPIPTPTEGETKSAFVSRCNGDPAMVIEFPDSKQRNAVCYRQWQENEEYLRKSYGPPPGGGQGSGNPKQGLGGRDKCECSKCGHIQAHERGTPCVDQKCSKCGAAMVPVTSNADIEEMEVFKPGKHNGYKYTDEHIDLLVENFKKLKGQIRPKLKITHDEDQKSVAGRAAYGDVTDVYSRIVKGVKKLFVKVANVPKEVKAWILTRRFPERSIEMWPKIEVEGDTFKWVLRNVALEGADPPAVPGMEPLKADSSDDEYVSVVTKLASEHSGIDIVSENVHDVEVKPKPKRSKGGDNRMNTMEKMQERIEKLEVTLDEVKATSAAEAKKLEDEVAEAEKKAADAEAEAQKAKEEKEAADKKVADAEKEKTELASKRKAERIDASLEGLKKNGHLDPKREPVARALMESFHMTAVKFSLADGKEDEASQQSLLETLLKDRTAQSFSEKSKNKGDAPVVEGSGVEDMSAITLSGTETVVGDGGASDELDKNIRAYMKQHNMKANQYEEAFNAVIGL